MAVSIKRRVALKGQSRSKFCGEPIRRGSKTPCLRLAGHKKAHRATTLRVVKTTATDLMKAEGLSVNDLGANDLTAKQSSLVIAAVNEQAQAGEAHRAKVRNLRPSKRGSRRRVAAPSKTVKRVRSIVSGKPSARLA